MVDYAIIGGTGIYEPDLLEDIEAFESENIYGRVKVNIGRYRKKRIAFLPRHGEGHSIPPHLINYRANIRALADLGVKKIISTSAVGSLREDFRPGDLALLDQFIDFTKARKNTFFEGTEGVLHVDMTEPYCQELSQALRENAGKNFLHFPTTYVCTEGPRFETPAEIRMFAKMGADVVGMTNVPEVILARELGMCYASIAIITNYAAGISRENLTHQEVIETMKNNILKVRDTIFRTIENIDNQQSCGCNFANAEAGNLGK